MGHRKKAVMIISTLEILAAAVLVSVPAVFPVCDAPMHCFYSYMAEIGTAAVVICAALISIFSKGLDTPRMLSGVTALCGVLAILYPSKLIGVCGSLTHPCHYGLLPVWNLAGGALVLLSVIMFFVAAEEKA